MKEEVEEAAAPATPWAASSRWWRMASRPAWAPTPIGTSGSTASLPSAVMSIQAVQGSRDWPRRGGPLNPLARKFTIPSTTPRKTPPGPPASPRPQNNAGGIEGGVSNGEDIVVRGYLKPISTLRKPLESVRFDSRQATSASYERKRHLRCAGSRRDRRSHGGADHRAPGPGKIRRRFRPGMRRNFDGYIQQIRNY